MKIGYNKIFGIFMFIPSFVVCCLGAVIVQGNEDIPATAVGTFWLGIVFGILFLTRPYVEITQNELVIKALLGPIAKRIPFNSPKDFYIERNTLYITRDGVRQKLGVAAWLTDKKGWNALVQWIEKGDNS